MSDLQPELRSVLTQLRSRIRRYVFLEGAALILAVLGGLFWLSLAVDHAWFQISRLELPRWFRVSFDVAVVGFVVFLLLSWIVLRLLRSCRTKALALVLERRFPELDDRLVTAPGNKTSGNSPRIQNRRPSRLIIGQMNRVVKVDSNRPTTETVRKLTILTLGILAEKLLRKIVKCYVEKITEEKAENKLRANVRANFLQIKTLKDVTKIHKQMQLEIFIFRTFSASISTQTTSFPVSAKHVPVTNPT